MIKIASGKTKDGIFIKVDEAGMIFLNGFVLYIHRDDYDEIENNLEKLTNKFETSLNKVLAKIKK